MKNFKISLVSWLLVHEEPLAIDWPKVHRELGIDQVDWLLEQPLQKCQLMVEKQGSHCCLTVEFYDIRSWREYHLLWAK
jgi:hypothetical protein